MPNGPPMGKKGITHPGLSPCEKLWLGARPHQKQAAGKSGMAFHGTSFETAHVVFGLGELMMRKWR